MVLCICLSVYDVGVSGLRYVNNVGDYINFVLIYGCKGVCVYKRNSSGCGRFCVWICGCVSLCMKVSAKSVGFSNTTTSTRLMNDEKHLSAQAAVSFA